LLEDDPFPASLVAIATGRPTNTFIIDKIMKVEMSSEGVGTLEVEE